MRAKRRHMHGKKLRRSPINYNFKSQKTFGEGKYGKALVNAVTPKGTGVKGMLNILPTHKSVKAAKTLWGLFKG